MMSGALAVCMSSIFALVALTAGAIFMAATGDTIRPHDWRVLGRVWLVGLVVISAALWKGWV